MREITIYSTGGGTSSLWVQAFRRGFPGKCIIQTNTKDAVGPIALFGDPTFEDLIDRAKEAGRDWFYGDHAFFGRKQYFRCALNRLMFDGAAGNDDPARFRSFNIPVKEWRTRGDHIVLCPNSERFLARYGAPNWVQDVQRELRKHTDRPFRLRWKKDAETRTLAADLLNAWAVVAFTSNSAVEGILEGIPAFCTAPCAGQTMGASDLSQIENPRMPDGREQWAARLANNQWTLAEMERGELWKAIGR